MKCHPPLKVQTADDGFRFVAVGESGRGRTLVRVPVGRSVPPGGETLNACDIRPAASGRSVVLEVERDPADSRALVYVRDHSGFRGSWRLFRGVLPPAPEGHPGQMDPDPDGLRTARVERLASIQMPSPQADFSDGPEWLSAGNGRVAVVARGECAQGCAGRMGGGPEFLLAVEPGTALTITRQGRLYGTPSRLIVEWDGDALSETAWEEYAARQDAGSAGGAAW